MRRPYCTRPCVTEAQSSNTAYQYESEQLMDAVRRSCQARLARIAMARMRIREKPKTRPLTIMAPPMPMVITRSLVPYQSQMTISVHGISIQIDTKISKNGAP
jgi:hypothetical protein